MEPKKVKEFSVASLAAQLQQLYNVQDLLLEVFLPYEKAEIEWDCWKTDIRRSASKFVSSLQKKTTVTHNLDYFSVSMG